MDINRSSYFDGGIASSNSSINSPQNTTSAVGQSPLTAARARKGKEETEVKVPLTQRSLIEHISLSFNYEEFKGTREELLEDIKSYNEIHELSLSYCSLLNASDLVAIVQAHPELVSLDLFDIMLPDQGFTLEHNNLRKLNAFIEGPSLKRITLVLPKLKKAYPILPVNLEHFEIKALKLKKFNFEVGRLYKTLKTLILKVDSLKSLELQFLKSLTYLGIKGKSLKDLKFWGAQQLKNVIVKAPHLRRIHIIECKALADSAVQRIVDQSQFLEGVNCKLSEGRFFLADPKFHSDTKSTNSQIDENNDEEAKKALALTQKLGSKLTDKLLNEWTSEDIQAALKVLQGLRLANIQK